MLFLLDLSHYIVFICSYRFLFVHFLWVFCYFDGVFGSEDEGQVELLEAVRLRERGSKRERERDRDFSNRKKRRGGEGFVQSGNEAGEEISDESLEDDEEYEEDDKAAWVIPSIAASSPSTSSQNNRKVFSPVGVAATTTEKVGRQNPAWKVTEEMIGVPVPRKARSGSGNFILD